MWMSTEVKGTGLTALTEKKKKSVLHKITAMTARL